ncbi:MFS transporter [Paenibacillus hamazuiensis]|uniref:MFS transporter n=1 Tax=Paenibacillus hamazuiensis TaxID=2936508 RepID=UPI0023DFC284|nr:MFS transporter [Paenibacillus hamazuiensis]
MRVVLSTVIVIALGFTTMMSITRPLVTLAASQLGAGAFEVGLLTAAYAFLPLLFAIYAGKLADKAGDKPPLIIGTIGAAVGLIIPYLAPSMLSLYVSQIVTGIAHILIMISLQNVLGHAAAEHNRDRYFSMFSMFVSVGGFVGPAAGGYLAETVSYSHAFLTASAIGILPILFSFFIPAGRKGTVKEDKTDGTRSGTLTLLKNPTIRKALASSALVLYSRDIFIAYYPLFAAKLGHTESQIGWIIALQGLAMVAVRLFLARLVDMFERRWVLLASIMLAGVSFLLFPLAGDLVIFAILSSVMGIGLGCGQPLSMTTTYNASPKSKTGEVLGLRLAINRLSQLIAPLIFGLIGAWGGIAFVFYFSGLFLVGGALFTRSGSGEASHAKKL